MFSPDQLVTSLVTLTGWRKDTNPEAFNNPMGDLLTASSGLFINDQHPLLTIKNLASIADDFSLFTYSDYSALTTYHKYSPLVISSDKYYKSVVDNNTNQLVTNTAYWRETTPFNEWLREKVAAAIIQCANDWASLKLSHRTAENLIKSDQVLNAPGIDAEAVGNTKRYINWRIIPNPAKGVILTIDRVSIQMVNSESVTIELYKNGAEMPLTSIVIDGDGTSDVIWKEVNWELERGNFYYLSIDRYSIDAIPINAIANVDKHAWFHNRFPGTLPYAEVGSFEHDGPGEDGWSDVSSIVSNLNSYGLNISFSAKYDYTEFIIDHKNLFAPAIAKRIAIDLLNTIAFNPNARINRNELNVDWASIKIDIDGHPQGRKAGLNAEYKAALNAISFDTRTLSKEGLPKRNTTITHKSV